MTAYIPRYRSFCSENSSSPSCAPSPLALRPIPSSLSFPSHPTVMQERLQQVFSDDPETQHKGLVELRRLVCSTINTPYECSAVIRAGFVPKVRRLSPSFHLNPFLPPIIPDLCPSLTFPIPLLVLYPSYSFRLSLFLTTYSLDCKWRPPGFSPIFPPVRLLPPHSPYFSLFFLSTLSRSNSICSLICLYISLTPFLPFCLGSSEHTSIVVAHDAIPPLVRLLTSDNPEVGTQCAWALGNIAGDNTKVPLFSYLRPSPAVSCPCCSAFGLSHPSSSSLPP